MYSFSKGHCIKIPLCFRMENVNKFKYSDFERDKNERRTDVIEIETETFAVRLFSNRSHMASKCGKNKKVAHETIFECLTDVLTTL